MSRLIDVDALIKDFDKRCFGECCCCIESTNTKSGCKVIDEQPTVDAVPVVRCKDCKHWYSAPLSDEYNSCSKDALIRGADFFCADGKKVTE